MLSKVFDKFGKHVTRKIIIWRRLDLLKKKKQILGISPQEGADIWKTELEEVEKFFVAEP